MKKPTIIDWIKSTCSSIGWKMFIWGLGITQEEYWNRIYLQERDEHIDKRRTGNSTRIVDNLIQDYFKKGIAAAYDHYPTRNAQKLVFNTTLNRLKLEHNILDKDICVNRDDLTLLNLKYELHNN